MATQDVTFAIPEDVASQLVAVRAEVRSELVAAALRKTLLERQLQQDWEAEMLAGCETIHADPDIANLELEMDALSGDGLDEYPWEQPASR